MSHRMTCLCKLKSRCDLTSPGIPPIGCLQRLLQQMQPLRFFVCNRVSCSCSGLIKIMHLCTNCWISAEAAKLLHQGTELGTRALVLACEGVGKGVSHAPCITSHGKMASKYDVYWYSPYEYECALTSLAYNSMSPFA